MKTINFNEIIKYVVCLILVCFVVMSNSGVISRHILFGIRNEVIPTAVTESLGGEYVLKEVFPAYGSRENYLTKYIDDKNYNIITDDVLATSASDTHNNVQSDTNASETSATEVCVSSEEETVEAVAVNSINTGYSATISYTPEQLENFEFLISNCYTVDGSTSITSKDINIENLLEADLTMDMSGEDYKVLIYHTHGSEAFVDSRPGMTEDTIIGVGDELTRILQEDYGIKTYHDTTIYDVVDGQLDRNYAYTQSGNGIDRILEQYPSIEVVLDIHRDGVRDDVRLMKVIDGKPTAQIMFFNGVSRLNEEGDLGYLNNPNLSTNLSFSLQMHLKGKMLYGDLMRKIYIGGYCYNLDRRPKASLIEVGAQTNTVEEAKNAMIPLAAILYSILSGN